MRVWVDGQCLQTLSRRRGIGRYVLEWLRELSLADNGVDVHVSLNAAMASEAIFARRLLGGIVDADRIHCWHGANQSGEGRAGMTSGRLFSQAALNYHVACIAPDIAVSASPFEGMADCAVPYVPVNGPTPFRNVAIFYDAIPHRMSETYLASPPVKAVYDRRLMGLRSFDGLLAISEYAEREARSFVPQIAVQNIMAAVHRDFESYVKADHSGIKIEFDRKKPSVLYVGGFDARKNVGRLIEAFGLMPANMIGRVQFIVIGDMDAEVRGNLRNQWQACGLPENNLFLLGYRSDLELAAYYCVVDLLVQPSLLEGFGLTALEAMTCGTPVIASNTGALPEVVGDPSRLFDPESPQDICRAMMGDLTANAASRAKQSKAAKERSKLFSWTNSAERSVAMFQSLLAPAKDETHSSADARKSAIRTAEELKIAPDTAALFLAAAHTRPSPGGRRIFIDISATTVEDHKTGIQRVVKNIAQSIGPDFETESGTTVEYIFLDDDRGFFRLDLTGAFEPGPVEITETAPIIFGVGDTIIMLDSTWAYHTLHYGVLQAARMRGARVVTVLYDLVPLMQSSFCDPGMPIVFNAWLRTALKYSDAFMCISEAVAKELKSVLGSVRYPMPKLIGHWPLGADFLLAKEKGVKPVRSRKAARPMFLTVGTVEPRKGHATILSAFDRLWSGGEDVELHIVGKIGWNNAHVEERIRTHKEFDRRLFWHVGISDTQLMALYRDCDALITASFAEGFGLPIVEAAQFGKPVIASDIAVFREVSKAAGHASFFIPGRPDELERAILEFLEAPPSAADLKAAKPQWPTWEESAKLLLQAVEHERWQFSHDPEVYDPINDDVLVWRMTGPVENGSRPVADLRLLEGPFRHKDGQRLIVEVCNLSETFWSSEGNERGVYAVNAGIRPLNTFGDPMTAEFPRVRIPLVIVPGDKVTLAFDIDYRWILRGAVEVEVFLVQEGVAYWEPTLRVDVRGLAELVSEVGGTGYA